MLETLQVCIVWICVTVIVHDVTGNVTKILNTIFVERVRAQIEEAQARKVEAQAQVIALREKRRDEIRERWTA